MVLSVVNVRVTESVAVRMNVAVPTAVEVPMTTGQLIIEISFHLHEKFCAQMRE